MDLQQWDLDMSISGIGATSMFGATKLGKGQPVGGVQPGGVFGPSAKDMMATVLPEKGSAEETRQQFLKEAKRSPVERANFERSNNLKKENLAAQPPEERRQAEQATDREFRQAMTGEEQRKPPVIEFKAILKAMS